MKPKATPDLTAPMARLGKPRGLAAFTMPIAILIFFICGTGPNVLLALLALCVFFFGTSLLWRPGEPPIQIAVFVVQWLQVSLLIFYANILGTDVNAISELSTSTDRAIILSEVGLVMFVVGMRLASGGSVTEYSELARNMALRSSVYIVFRIYIAFFAIACVTEGLAWTIPGLAQPLIALAALRWGFFGILTYICFTRRRGYPFFFIAFALELAWGLGGVYSDFKTVFIYALIAIAAANRRIALTTAAGLGLLAALLIFLGIVWTSVKFNYRDFLSSNKEISLGTTEKISKLAELISTLDGEALTKGAEKLVQRITYVEYFGVVLDYVPNTQPHENGAIWWDAVTRPFMPRLFFPSKAIIDNSERTRKYTGLGVSGTESDTSISIGYFGEAYIDFGAVLMMVPIFLLGLAYGRAYRWLISSKASKGLLGIGFAPSTLFCGLFAETSITKSFGAFVLFIIFAWVLTKYIAPRAFPALQTKSF